MLATVMTLAVPLVAANAKPIASATAPSFKSVRAMSSFDGYRPRRDGSRLIGLIAVIALHVAAVALLLTYQPAREMLGLSKPVMVEFINPPAPPAPEPPKEQPKPREVEVVHKQPPVPKQVIATTSPAPSPMVVQQAPEPPKPQPPVEAAAPSPPAPPAPAAPAEPKVVSGVEYVRKPEPVYPAMSRRLNEQGKVILRVLINTQGKPENVQIKQGSGSPRLDEAARVAVLEALFKPYIENGVPRAAIATIPINFSLND